MKFTKKLLVAWADYRIRREEQKPEGCINWDKIALLNHIATYLEGPRRDMEEDIRKVNAMWKKVALKHPDEFADYLRDEEQKEDMNEEKQTDN